MPYSLKDAADASGKSKPTILRAIQSGKISAEKDANGEWQIEPAELHRVYQPVTERTVADTTTFNDTQHHNLPFEMGVLTGEVEQLREQLTSLNLDRERERREATDQIEDLRKRLDQADKERREKDIQLTALLTDQSKQTPPVIVSPAPPPAVSIPQPANRRSFLSLFRRRSG